MSILIGIILGYLVLGIVFAVYMERTDDHIFETDIWTPGIFLLLVILWLPLLCIIFHDWIDENGVKSAAQKAAQAVLSFSKRVYRGVRTFLGWLNSARG